MITPRPTPQPDPEPLRQLLTDNTAEILDKAGTLLDAGIQAQFKDDTLTFPRDNHPLARLRLAAVLGIDRDGTRYDTPLIDDHVRRPELRNSLLHVLDLAVDNDAGSLRHLAGWRIEALDVDAVAASLAERHAQLHVHAVYATHRWDLHAIARLARKIHPRLRHSNVAPEGPENSVQRKYERVVHGDQDHPPAPFKVDSQNENPRGWGIDKCCDRAFEYDPSRGLADASASHLNRFIAKENSPRVDEQQALERPAGGEWPAVMASIEHHGQGRKGGPSGGATSGRQPIIDVASTQPETGQTGSLQTLLLLNLQAFAELAGLDTPAFQRQADSAVWHARLRAYVQGPELVERLHAYANAVEFDDELLEKRPQQRLMELNTAVPGGARYLTDITIEAAGTTGVAPSATAQALNDLLGNSSWTAAEVVEQHTRLIAADSCPFTHTYSGPNGIEDARHLRNLWDETAPAQRRIHDDVQGHYADQVAAVVERHAPGMRKRGVLPADLRDATTEDFRWEICHTIARRLLDSVGRDPIREEEVIRNRWEETPEWDGQRHPTDPGDRAPLGHIFHRLFTEDTSEARDSKFDCYCQI